MSKQCNYSIPDEWLNCAVALASFIHRHEEVVKEIVFQASRDLSITSTKQSKRRFAKPKQPTRIYHERKHLLQYLVFLHSESHERAQETYAPDSISEEDMITRYLALIVRKSMKRNSLYGVTGVCRFICNYEFKDVRKIHEVVLDEPEHYKDEVDFRKNKQTMFRMIFERFPKHLRIEETRNGKEKHFILRENQNDLSLIRLIKQSLDSFKPWYTECLSAGFMPNEEKQNIFRQSDKHDVREIKRLHTLIHQDCFITLTNALGMDFPDTRLGIPQFYFVKPFDEMPSNAEHPGSYAPSGSSGDDSSKTSSQAQMLEGLRKLLAKQAERLKRFIPEGVLTVKIDGKDSASFNLDITNHVQFTMDEGAERVEIVAESEQLVLAVHLLDDEIWQSQNRKFFYTVLHENGAKVTFVFKRITNVDTGISKVLVTVTYKETSIRRSLVLQWRRLRIRVSNWKPVKELSPVTQQAIEVNSQFAKQLEERKFTLVSLVAWYCLNNGILRKGINTLALVIKHLTYVTVHLCSNVHLDANQIQNLKFYRNNGVL